VGTSTPSQDHDTGRIPRAARPVNPVRRARGRP